MMTPVFRVVLIVVSIVTMIFMMRRISQSKIQIEAAVFWVFVAAVCPPVADACARLLGIYSTPNFLFLLTIFLLMIKVFSLTLQVSQLESKQKELVQKMALEQLMQEKQEKQEKEVTGGEDEK